MKVRASVKPVKGCKKCRARVRRGYLFITCEEPKHRQRQG